MVRPQRYPQSFLGCTDDRHDTPHTQTRRDSHDGPRDTARARAIDAHAEGRPHRTGKGDPMVEMVIVILLVILVLNAV